MLLLLNEKLMWEKKMVKVVFESLSEDVSDVLVSDGLLEIVFIGRLNVGKLLLLNLIMFGAGAAAVSAKSGTTVSMNYYLVDKKWWLVDLLGYGYVKVDVEVIE